MPKFYEIDVETNSNNHKVFKMCLKDKYDNLISTGTGASKKEAENEASRLALKKYCSEYKHI
jgi:dsRNA-specific ribonuclease